MMINENNIKQKNIKYNASVSKLAVLAFIIFFELFGDVDFWRVGISFPSGIFIAPDTGVLRLKGNFLFGLYFGVGLPDLFIQIVDIWLVHIGLAVGIFLIRT